MFGYLSIIERHFSVWNPILLTPWTTTTTTVAVVVISVMILSSQMMHNECHRSRCAWKGRPCHVTPSMCLLSRVNDAKKR